MKMSVRCMQQLFRQIYTAFDMLIHTSRPLTSNTQIYYVWNVSNYFKQTAAQNIMANALVSQCCCSRLFIFFLLSSFHSFVSVFRFRFGFSLPFGLRHKAVKYYALNMYLHIVLLSPCLRNSFLPSALNAIQK